MMAGAPGWCEKCSTRRIGLEESAEEFRPNLISSGRNRRADDGGNIGAVGAQGFHRTQSCLRDAGESALPAGMGDADSLARPFGENNWRAIGGEGSQGNRWLARDHRIGHGSRSRLPWFGDGDDGRAVLLVYGEEIAGPDA